MTHMVNDLMDVYLKCIIFQEESVFDGGIREFGDHNHETRNNLNWFFCRNNSLPLLTWPTCIYIMINVGGWNSLPVSEDIGALVTNTSGLCATLYIHPARPPPKRLRLFYHIIISPSSTPTLQSLQLQLSFPRL